MGSAPNAPFWPEGEPVLRAGTRLGPWELIALLGEGGMAEVWAAREVQHGTIVALKVLSPHLADREAMREMFVDEAAIATRLDHPNVCRTFALQPLEGFLTIVMEWVDGVALGHILRPGEKEDDPKLPLPHRHAARIIADAGAGLHAAHELRDEEGRLLHVVHRDVSPQNILVSRNGVVKVTDFGVAKALGKLHVTLAGHLKGKLPYMSPEHLGGEIDRRSDVFSLGIVLYELTTGERPFKGDHDPQLMAAIARGEYQPAWAIAPGYPPELDAIIHQALAVDPATRYPTALAMSNALEAWLANGPPVGGPQIAALLEERCGAEVAANAAKVTPSTAITAPVVSVAPPVVTINRPLYRGRQRQQISTLWASVSVFIGFALGLGVLFFVNESRHAHAAVSRRDPGPPAVSAPPAPSNPSTVVAIPAVGSQPTPSRNLDLPTAPSASVRKRKAKPSIVVPPNPYD